MSVTSMEEVFLRLAQGDDDGGDGGEVQETPRTDESTTAGSIAAFSNGIHSRTPAAVEEVELVTMDGRPFNGTVVAAPALAPEAAAPVPAEMEGGDGLLNQMGDWIRGQLTPQHTPYSTPFTSERGTGSAAAVQPQPQQGEEAMEEEAAPAPPPPSPPPSPPLHGWHQNHFMSRRSATTRIPTLTTTLPFSNLPSSGL